MIMEAMRLSLIEHEDQQRKEAEEKRKKEKEGKQSDGVSGRDAGGAGPSSSSSGLPPIPVSAPISVAQLKGRTSEPQSASSSRPSLSSDHRPSSGSFGESASPPLNRSIPPPGPLTHGGLHSGSGSATPNFREVTLRKSLDTSLPSLPGSASASQDVISAGESAPSAKQNVSAPEVAEDRLSSAASSSASPASQKQTASVPVPPTTERKETSMSVTTVASELTGGGSYDELPSSPDSPSHRPLLLETPALEHPEPGSLIGPEGGGNPRVVTNAE